MVHVQLQHMQSHCYVVLCKYCIYFNKKKIQLHVSLLGINRALGCLQKTRQIIGYRATAILLRPQI